MITSGIGIESQQRRYPSTPWPERHITVPTVPARATVRVQAAAMVCPTPPFPMVHGTRLGRRRLGAKWRRSRVLRKLS